MFEVVDAVKVTLIVSPTTLRLKLVGAFGAVTPPMGLSVPAISTSPSLSTLNKAPLEFSTLNCFVFAVPSTRTVNLADGLVVPIPTLPSDDDQSFRPHLLFNLLFLNITLRVYDLV